MAQATTEESAPGGKTALKRGITGTLLFFFILGDTLGAGIYSLMGVMAKDVGGVLWLPLIIALVVALLTAGTYAELITKYPHAGGAARYADRAFKQPAITFFVGFLMMASGITTAAALANAFSGDYLQELRTLPPVPVTIGLLVLLVAINMRGVNESMKANMGMAIIETTGLVIVIVMAAMVFGSGDGDPGRLVEFNPDVAPLTGVFGASIIAFFSFLGFEAAANMAEEVQDPSKAYPKALFGAILTAGVVYLLIAAGAAIVMDPLRLADSSGPLLEVVREAGFDWTQLFSVIALIAVTNGCLLFMVMASRVGYGLSDAGLLPRAFGKVLPGRRTPWVSILVVGGVTMLMSFLGNVGELADTTVLLLLLVFISANISVLVLKKDEVDHEHFSVPRIVPILATIASVGLLTQQDPETWKVAGIYALVGALLYGVALISRKAEDNLSTDNLGG